ncbi:MAG: metalloregulator ArsR/SmtB family transcription factor [Nanoarchaeota archaeon]
MKNKELVRFFKALGNERRLLMIMHLAKSKELTVGQISKLMNLSFKATSKHLIILYNAKLLNMRQVDLNKFYSIGNSPLLKKVLNPK